MSAAVAVIGAGAWGTALAQMIASDGTPVLLWALEAELVDAVNRARRNPLYLPDIPLHDAIEATDDLGAASAADTVLMVTPAQHMRRVLETAPRFSGDIVLCAKGIEQRSGAFMLDVARDFAADAQIAILSGPTFAHEIARGQPGAVTLACAEVAQWERLSRTLSRPHFRPYYSADRIGAEIGGAVKNVLAIGCGVVDGLGLGQNARAALIARGFAEMTRFGLACGAEAETLSGLSGLGDLVLTCSSDSSRNFSLGRELGQGRLAADILGSRNSVAEGAHSAPALLAKARTLGVDMPIAEAVASLLTGERDAAATVARLLARPLKAETVR